MATATKPSAGMYKPWRAREKYGEELKAYKPWHELPWHELLEDREEIPDPETGEYRLKRGFRPWGQD